jgi:hypothetical protein
VTNDIDTLATALYVRTGDLLKQYLDLAPWRPKAGLQPRLTDAELVTLAVMLRAAAKDDRSLSMVAGETHRSLPRPG